MTEAWRWRLGAPDPSEAAWTVPPRRRRRPPLPAWAIALVLLVGLPLLLGLWNRSQVTDRAASGSVRTTAATPSTAATTTSTRPRPSTTPSTRARSVTNTSAPAVVTPVTRNRESATLRVGDCANRTSTPAIVEFVDVMPCNGPHESEVLLLFRSADAGGSYPGRDVLYSEAEDACVSAFESKLGESDRTSPLGIRFLIPTKDQWTMKRTFHVTCLVDRDDGATMSRPLAALR